MIPGEKVDPKTTSTVVVEKESKGFVFASAAWHFSTEKLPAEDRGDFFSRLAEVLPAREERDGSSSLTPLAEGAVLRPGDEIEVQISLRTKHEAEYVHLRDPRAAGLEPENAVSRWKWDLGIAWYEETRDSATNFFFERLPVGRVHVQVPPAREHGGHVPRRPRDGAVDVRARVQRLLGGRGPQGGGRIASMNRVPSTGWSLYGGMSAKPSESVERLGRRHRRQRVEADARDTRSRGPRPSGRLGEPPAEARPAKGRPHPEPLHFADPSPIFLRAMQPAGSPREREQEPAVGGAYAPGRPPAPRRNSGSRARTRAILVLREEGAGVASRRGRLPDSKADGRSTSRESPTSVASGSARRAGAPAPSRGGAPGRARAGSGPPGGTPRGNASPRTRALRSSGHSSRSARISALPR